MKPINCKLVPYFKESEEKIIYMPMDLAKRLKLDKSKQYKIVLGSRQVLTKVDIISGSQTNGENLLWLTPILFKALKLPENMSLGITYLEQEFLKIGPVIGILTERKLLEKYMRGKSTREEFDFYSQAGEESSSLVYIFSMHGVNWQDKFVEGYLRVRDHSGIPCWEKRKLPLPDGIHNRISFSRGSSVNDEIKLLKQQMKKLLIINRITAISKWEVARVLQKCPLASEYVPETKLLQGPETITEMSEKYSDLYLKPVRRSLGLGVIKLTKKTSENYAASYRKGKRSMGIEGKIDDMLLDLRCVMGRRTYIVQQGINLAKYQDRLFDLRVTMQKDGTGKWSLSSWGTRVGALGSNVTNVAAGGKGIPIEKVLGAVFGSRYEEITSEINKASLIICEALDKGLNEIGDVGLDIGVDVNGKPYLIEVNFRDHRLTADEMDDPKSWAITYKKPVFYLKYLYETAE